MLTQRELLTMLDELETLSCQLPTQWHRALARLQAETTPKELGAKSWKDVLRIRWRITATDANRRLAEAADLGPRRTLTGESLAPVLAATAAAQAAGLINSEHIDKIRDTMAHIPSFVDTPTREQIETDLVRLAVGVGPTELKKAADKVLFLLDQDGPEPDDAERARKRGLHFGPQSRDGTVPARATSPPKPGRSMKRSSPNPAHRACAIPTTTNPASVAHRHRNRSTTTTAPWRSDNTTR